MFFNLKLKKKLKRKRFLLHLIFELKRNCWSITPWIISDFALDQRWNWKGNIWRSKNIEPKSTWTLQMMLIEIFTMNFNVFFILLITETWIIENKILTTNHFFDKLKTIVSRNDLTQRQMFDLNYRIGLSECFSHYDQNNDENCWRINTRKHLAHRTMSMSINHRYSFEDLTSVLIDEFKIDLSSLNLTSLLFYSFSCSLSKNRRNTDFTPIHGDVYILEISLEKQNEENIYKKQKKNARRKTMLSYTSECLE